MISSEAYMLAVRSNSPIYMSEYISSESLGFTEPSAIQQRVILPIIQGRDVIVQARSGTRKMVAFAIPILQSIDVTVSEPQAIILTSTRESATEIQPILLALGTHMNVHFHACTWDTTIDEDMRQLKYEKHVIIGTPEDVSDLIQKQCLRTHSVKMLVLDEVDELLGEKSIDFVHNIYRCLSSAIQSVILGTTFSYEILRIITKFMTDPIRILVKDDDIILDGQKQYYVALEKEDWKFATLCDLHNTLPAPQIVVFCYTEQKVSTYLCQMICLLNFQITRSTGS